jgi:hypothetical protein
MENRHGLMVNAMVTSATGRAERDAALVLVDKRPPTRRITLGGDKNYDTHQFVQDLRALQVTPHVAQHTTNRASAIDGRTTRHPGYAISQQKRKRVEEIFSWLKTVGLCGRSNSVVCDGSAGCSPSLLPCTAWCGSAISWRLPHEPIRIRRALRGPQRASTVGRDPLMDGLRRLV